MKRISTLFLAALMTLGESLPVMPGAAMAVSTLVFVPASLQALPYYHPVSRSTTKTASRHKARRHVWSRPGASFPWEGFTYYRSGGVYYHPYLYGGRTIYVEVDVDAKGKPLPPPSPSQVSIDINIGIDD